MGRALARVGLSLLLLAVLVAPAAAQQGITIVASGPCPTVQAGGPTLYPGSFCFRTDNLTLSLFDGITWRPFMLVPLGVSTVTFPNPTITTPILTAPTFQTAPLAGGAYLAARAGLPPGFGSVQWFVRPGTTVGTCKLTVLVGNSTVETTVPGLDNLPAGPNGC